jgi:hypothetical protein
MVVNNMRANVDVLPYDDHDRAVKLLHSLDRTVWGGKFKAIVESEKYDTLTVNELFSKLRSAEVDRGMTAKIEGPTDSHSLTLIGGSKGKSNANPSTKMFSLSSLMSLPDEEFDVLGKDELALLCNTPPTKAAPLSPSVGASTQTHSTLLTLSSSLRVKGLTRGWYGWWTKAYKLAPPLLN